MEELKRRLSNQDLTAAFIRLDTDLIYILGKLLERLFAETAYEHTSSLLTTVVPYLVDITMQDFASFYDAYLTQASEYLDKNNRPAPLPLDISVVRLRLYQRQYRYLYEFLGDLSEVLRRYDHIRDDYNFPDLVGYMTSIICQTIARLPQLRASYVVNDNNLVRFGETCGLFNEPLGTVERLQLALTPYQLTETLSTTALDRTHRRIIESADTMMVRIDTLDSLLSRDINQAEEDIIALRDNAKALTENSIPKSSVSSSGQSSRRSSSARENRASTSTRSAVEPMPMGVFYDDIVIVPSLAASQNLVNSKIELITADIKDFINTFQGIGSRNIISPISALPYGQTVGCTLIDPQRATSSSDTTENTPSLSSLPTPSLSSSAASTSKSRGRPRGGARSQSSSNNYGTSRSLGMATQGISQDHYFETDNDGNNGKDAAQMLANVNSQQQNCERLLLPQEVLDVADIQLREILNEISTSRKAGLSSIVLCKKISEMDFQFRGTPLVQIGSVYATTHGAKNNQLPFLTMQKTQSGSKVSFEPVIAPIDAPVPIYTVDKKLFKTKIDSMSTNDVSRRLFGRFFNHRMYARITEYDTQNLLRKYEQLLAPAYSTVPVTYTEAKTFIQLIDSLSDQTLASDILLDKLSEATKAYYGIQLPIDKMLAAPQNTQGYVLSLHDISPVVIRALAIMVRDNVATRQQVILTINKIDVWAGLIKKITHAVVMKDDIWCPDK